MLRPFARAKSLAGSARRALFPKPEVEAYRKICDLAGRMPRRVPGRIELMGYSITYLDLLTVAPQWKELFLKRSYDFQSATPSPRILDCGANIGLASLFFKRRYPDARITAFEADGAVCAALRENMAANAVSGVEVVCAAVWTEDGRVPFRHEGADSGAVAAVGGDGEGEPVFDVPAVRLRDLLAKESEVDVLKLDIEGSEHDVLADCEPFLGRVKAILLELHEFEPARRRIPATLEVLSRAGFTYSTMQCVPFSFRTPTAGFRSPFPSACGGWCELVYAWRSD
jgi:FkbM family methyltransferase